MDPARALSGTYSRIAGSNRRSKANPPISVEVVGEPITTSISQTSAVR